MQDAVIPLLTGLFGAAVGFVVTRLNDWLSEHRTIRRATRHLRTELANVSRHYAYMRDRLAPYATTSAWLNIVHLETCRFYGAGLGTFDIGTLRLFNETIASEVMYLILGLRNNNAYIDLAKQYLADGDKATFAELCDELLKRCDETIERAHRIQGELHASRRQ